MAYKLFLLFCILSCAVLIQSAPQGQALNNDPGMRGVSNYLDRALGWDGYEDPSKIRATLHAGYHELQHLITGNPREHERAKDQWGVATGGATNNLKNYDQQHGK